MRLRIVTLMLVLFGWTTAVSAQEPALDIIPHDAGRGAGSPQFERPEGQGENSSPKN